MRSLEIDHSKTKVRLTQIDADIREIRKTLETTATKGDIADLRLLIEHSVNGLLRDALNSVPGKQAALWTVIAALISAAALAFGFFQLFSMTPHPAEIAITPPAASGQPAAPSGGGQITITPPAPGGKVTITPSLPHSAGTPH